MAEVVPLVDWADRHARAGAWATLLLAYDAAPAWDPALSVQAAAGPVPLAWAAVYDRQDPDAVAPPATAFAPPSWRPAITPDRFARDIDAILGHIAAGDTYQVNYTFPMLAPFTHEPWSWFRACAAQADVPYAAYVDLGDAVVMSLSPELFLERIGGRLRARPMKGTTRRGRWLAEDRALAESLQRSEKARAENVMIVDLLRNDLGRIARTGSVHVPDLCTLERYPTVWQLTSGVEASVPPSVPLREVLAAAFPCGSVTGAPKVRTMGLIAELEAAPRGIYTGAIVQLRPGGDFTASVPIRTAVLDRARGVATFSVGAGITADSSAEDEWAECLAKSRVVRPPAVPDGADLLETLRLEHGTCLRRAGHLARLAASATLFGWPCRTDDLAARLDEIEQRHSTGVWRARLLMSRDGHTRVEVSPLIEEPRRWRVALAHTRVDARSPLLFNKTTSRAVYEEARAERPDLDDVLLANVRGEVTESTVANLVVDLDGRRLTPPLTCGLLPGVFRQHLLTQGEVVEAVLRPEDLSRATRIWLVNSLRGWIDVELTA